MSGGVDTPVPRLVGMTAQDIKTAMKDFASGARPATIMNRISKGFTEPESAAIADWYAAQPK
jgi:cytochrome c553